jgi:hypothetical protein
MFTFDPTINFSTIVQLLGFGGTIWIVFYQFKKQRQLQREKHRVNLELQIYEKVVFEIEASSPTGIAMSLNILFGALQKASDKHDQTGTYVPPPFKTEDLHSEFSNINSNLWKVASTIEKYEIIAPHLKLFREAIVQKLREFANAYIPIIETLPHVLPSKNDKVSNENLLVLKGEDMEIFKENVKHFAEISYDIAGFLYDIQVELQNRFLGPFFNRNLPVRVPHDKSALVLTSSNTQKLREIHEYVSKQTISNEKSH